MTTLPRDFGDGWMTKNAADLAKIAVTCGGFDAAELVQRLARAGTGDRNINAGTVERILDEMWRESKTADELAEITRRRAETVARLKAER